MTGDLSNQREDIIKRLCDDAGFSEEQQNEMKGIMRKIWGWGVLLERDRIKGVFGKASFDAFADVQPVNVKDLP